MFMQSALSWSVFQAFKDRMIALLGMGVFFFLPLKLFFPRFSTYFLLLVSFGLGIAWKILRKRVAVLATKSLSRGDSPASKRFYQFLNYSTLKKEDRNSCRLSLAACLAVEGDYQSALNRLSSIGRNDLKGALLAVSYNLEAYCLGRKKESLSEALELAGNALLLRPSVPGFKHTQALVLLELGQFQKAIQLLESLWNSSGASDALEAERCFDLGRLWWEQGHESYAADYYRRACQACPDSSWAKAAMPFVINEEE